MQMDGCNKWEVSITKKISLNLVLRQTLYEESVLDSLCIYTYILTINLQVRLPLYHEDILKKC